MKTRLSRRLLQSLTVAVMTMLVLAACSPGGQPAATQPQPAPSVPPGQQAATAAPEQPAAPDEPKAETAEPVKPLGRFTFGFAGTAPTAWPVLIAQEKGFFAKYGLEAELLVLNSAPRAIQAMLANQVHIVASVGATAAADAILSGFDVPVVAAIEEGLIFDLFGAPGVNSAEDLKGKGIAINPGVVEYAARVALDQMGLNHEQDVTFVNVGAQPVRATAVTSGTVGASPLNRTYREQMLKDGATLLVPLSDMKYPYLQGGVVTTGSFLRNNRPVVKAYLAAFAEGIAWLKDPANKVEAKEILGAWLRNNDEAFLNSAWEAAHTEYLARPIPSRAGARNVWRSIALDKPEADRMAPEDLIDPSVLNELEQEGLFDKLSS